MLAHEPELLSNRTELETAAVALVLREHASDLELLFIQRAKHPKDPWSGHMAFPGGRMDPGDPDGKGAARRETLEELALDLERDGELLGRLSDLHVYGRGTRLAMYVEPCPLSEWPCSATRSGSAYPISMTLSRAASIDSSMSWCVGPIVKWMSGCITK